MAFQYHVDAPDQQESGERPIYTIKIIIKMQVSELVPTRIVIWKGNYAVRHWK
jgi:hypothetical protein